MKAILRLRRYGHLKAICAFLIAVSLIAGVAGCEGEGEADYSLTMVVSPAGSGTATDETGTSPYAGGAAVNIKAVPAPCYRFANWTASAGGFIDPAATDTTFTMPAQDVTITAHFEAEGANATVLLVVNGDLYDQIRENLVVFGSDLCSEGYSVEIEVVNGATEPPEIRNLIKSYYDAGDLVGAILMGDIKAPYFESRTGDFSNPDAWKVWISLDATDMYYMDMDGDWEHLADPDFCEDAPPNVAECHLYSSCETFSDQYLVYFDESEEWDYSNIEDKDQYQIEIWVSRIMAHNLDIPDQDESEIINDYLEWNHGFRNGEEDIESKAYILNSGAGYNDQNMDFTEIFDDTIRAGNVTESQYIDYLEDIGGSELMYFTAHSSPQVHVWYDGSLSVDELLNLKKNSVFYMLNACSSCRWDQYVTSPSNPNYMGGLYVLDKHVADGGYGVGAIGFTGVGGFNNLEFFTDYLNSVADPTYGDAFVFWFNLNLMINFGPNNYVFLGDPTIGPYHSSG